MALLTASLGAVGCDDEVTRHPATPRLLDTSSNGDGGQGAGGGAAGGGSAVGGSGGIGGGSPTDCLSAAEHLNVFTIEQVDLCLVAKYTAAVEVGYTTSPTWGNHGGPLTATYQRAPVDEATVTRWVVPSQAQGTLGELTTTVALDISADPVFFGAQAVDVPFFAWTFLSWTGAFGSSDGELIAVVGNTVAQRRPVAGLYGVVGVGAPFDDGRLLHTSLTPLDEPNATPQPALYSADYCPGPTACGGRAVAAWGEATGPVAVDADGNLFAMQPSLSTNQQTLRGFEASTVVAKAPPAEGAVLLTLPGFGSELAAMGPRGTEPGVVLFQPFSSSTYDAYNVISLPYWTSHASIQLAGAVSVAIALTQANTAVSLMTDHLGRLWLGAVTGAGETTFYVLDRR